MQLQMLVLTLSGAKIAPLRSNPSTKVRDLRTTARTLRPNSFNKVQI